MPLFLALRMGRVVLLSPAPIRHSVCLFSRLLNANCGLVAFGPLLTGTCMLISILAQVVMIIFVLLYVLSLMLHIFLPAVVATVFLSVLVTNLRFMHNIMVSVPFTILIL